MRDYWVSKLFFDMQQPQAAEEYRANRDKVLDRYPLKPEMRQAIVSDDVATLAKVVNPYLLRFFYVAIGKPESWFLERISKTAQSKEAVHG
ncbi:MAG: hypothetical protein A3G27_11020 [Betaproteobacteria bacterium RIFCSPLOWO2_12_FULL_66_14]|nr:MAG: hypothetical protein A3G27_11020 [Betaproteobacteria bacterium RIFCSPLOWO2_12_FULL_66_14]